MELSSNNKQHNSLIVAVADLMLYNATLKQRRNVSNYYCFSAV